MTPTTDTSSRRTGSSGAGNGSGDPPMDHCATPGILGTSEGQFGPREVPATTQGGRVGKHELPSTTSGLVQRQLVQTSGGNTGYMREA